MAEPINAECCDCHGPFVISPGEQEFYAGKGFVLPKRCPDCRRKKKLARGTTRDSTRDSMKGGKGYDYNRH